MTIDKHERHPIRPSCWTALIAAAVYAASPLHRLAGGDSGELMAEACVGGVAHPPGYPLLLALLQLVRWTTRRIDVLLLALAVASPVASSNNEEQESLEPVPFVRIANALNAVFAVGAAACVTHVVDLWTNQAAPIEAIAAGLMFATSPLVWEYAIGLEVFALNNLLAGVLHILILRHCLHPTARTAFAGAFVCGLGLANQHTLLLFEAPFIAFVLWTNQLSLRQTFVCALCFLAGASVYVYTFVSAQQPTIGSWGNASTLAGLWTHVLRREYGTFRLSPLQLKDSETLIERIQLYALDTLSEFNSVGVACACVGALRLAKLALSPLLASAITTDKQQQQRYSRALLAAMTTYLLTFHALANIPLQRDPLARAVARRFDMQPNTVVAISLGIGLATTTKWLLARLSSSVALRTFVQCIRLSVVAAMIAYQLVSGFRIHALHSSEDDPIRLYSESLLQSLPPQALLLSFTDIQWNAVRYLQVCEQQRRDVTHVSLQLMPFPWFERQHALYTNLSEAGGSSKSVRFPPIERTTVSTDRTSVGYKAYLETFLLANLPQFPHRVFLDLHAVSDSDIQDGGVFHGVLLTPHGALWQVHEANEAPLLFARWEQSHAALATVRQTTTRRESFAATGAAAPGSWAFATQSIANDGAYQAALYRLSHWLAQAKHIGDIDSLGAFVDGLHSAAIALDATTRACDDTSYKSDTSNAIVTKNVEACIGSLSYPAFDVKKNAAVAWMRFQTGLDVLASLVHTQNWRRAVRTSPTLQALAADVLPLASDLRTQAIATVQALLPALHAQSDDHVGVFIEFLDTAQRRSRSSDLDLSGQPATTQAAIDASAMAKKKPKTKVGKKKTRKCSRNVDKEATLRV